MSAELAQLLGGAQYSQYVNTRIASYGRLAAMARNAEASYLAIKARGEFVINEITRNIRLRAQNPDNYERDITRLGRSYYGAGVSTYQPPSTVRGALSSISNIPSHFGPGVYSVEFRPTYSSTRGGHIIRPGGVDYYRIGPARIVPNSLAAPGAADMEIARRLGANTEVQNYRARRAEFEAARARQLGFKVLG